MTPGECCLCCPALEFNGPYCAQQLRRSGRDVHYPLRAVDEDFQPCSDGFASCRDELLINGNEEGRQTVFGGVDWSGKRKWRRRDLEPENAPSVVAANQECQERR